VEAYKWYQLAIRQGEPNAGVNKKRLLPKLTAEQIAEGERRAREFVPKPVAPPKKDL